MVDDESLADCVLVRNLQFRPDSAKSRSVRKIKRPNEMLIHANVHLHIYTIWSYVGVIWQVGENFIFIRKIACIEE